MRLPKFTQFNVIDDIYEPRYHDKKVLIARNKINYRKQPHIKLVFEKVNPTSEYAGQWYISRKRARQFKKDFDNNGLECYVIPWEAFEKLEIEKHSMQEVW